MKKTLSIVIPVSDRSKCGHIDLHYAIRSLRKHLNNIGDIFIVGDKTKHPKGFKCVHFIDDTQSRFKERNIFRKIIAACNHPDITDDFLFTNDDIFLTHDFDALKLPFYHKGDLSDTLSRNAGDYRRSLNHSRKYLIKNEKPTFDYDTHFPIVYNKKKFIDTFVCKDIDWDIPYGFVIKSIYCNMNSVEGEFGGDCKIQTKLSYDQINDKIKEKKFFSTSDGVLNEDMLKFLEEKYPRI